MENQNKNNNNAENNNSMDNEYVSIPMFEEFEDQDMYPGLCNDLFGVIS
ncbi:hypothetical protein NE664_05540 [Anaerotignum faecicola]|nr:hypothetical protein [Anaerotignum faecicola]